MTKKKKKETTVPVTINLLAEEELKKKIKDQFVTHGKSEDVLEKEFGKPRGTISSWAFREGWRDERKRFLTLAKQVAETVKFLSDPNTEDKAIIEGNARMAIEIQGMHLAKIKSDMLYGNTSIGLVETINKYAAALDKLNNTLAKSKAGNVDEKVVRHIHKIDMDEAVKIALEARKRGQIITVGQAAEAMIEQMDREAKDGSNK